MNKFHNVLGTHSTRLLTLDKPISVAMSIVQLSKCVMYEHHYNYVMKKYGHEKAKLMITDTDSLLHIQCQNAGTL